MSASTPARCSPLLQTASLVSPVRYFMEIILGVFLKGAGWTGLWPKVVILAIIGGVLFVSAGYGSERSAF